MSKEKVISGVSPAQSEENNPSEVLQPWLAHFLANSLEIKHCRGRTEKFILNPGMVHEVSGVWLKHRYIGMFCWSWGLQSTDVSILLSQSVGSLLKKKIKVYSKSSKLNIMVWNVEYTRLVSEKLYYLKNFTDHLCFFLTYTNTSINVFFLTS